MTTCKKTVRIDVNVELLQVTYLLSAIFRLHPQSIFDSWYAAAKTQTSINGYLIYCIQIGCALAHSLRNMSPSQGTVKWTLGESSLKTDGAFWQWPTNILSELRKRIDNSQWDASSFLKIPGCIWLQPFCLGTPLPLPAGRKTEPASFKGEDTTTCFSLKIKKILSCTSHHIHLQWSHFIVAIAPLPVCRPAGIWVSRGPQVKVCPGLHPLSLNSPNTKIEWQAQEGLMSDKEVILSSRNGACKTNQKRRWGNWGERK